MHLPLNSPLKHGLIVIVSVILLGLAAAAIAAKSLFSIRVPHGSPVGPSLRAGTHIATLIQTLEPYLVSLHRNPANDRFRVGLFLQPVDGRSPGRLIPIGRGFRAGQLGLIRLIAFDGSVVWFDVTGIGGVNLESGKLVSAAELQAFKAGPGQRDRGGALQGSQSKPEAFLVPSAFPATNEWLALISQRDAERGFKPGSWVRPGNRAGDAKEVRHLFLGTLNPVPKRSTHEILSLTPAPGEGWLSAAFVSADRDSDAMRLSGPDGFLMVYTSEPGPKGTLMVARVDTRGQRLWTIDTSLDRLQLQQILPDARSIAFVGTRLPIPDKVSEPLLVIVDTQSGKPETHSLWR
jgi:hypothetical protein